MSNFSWTCPYCQQNATITDEQQSVEEHDFNENNKDGYLRLISKVIVCPNIECKEYSINVSLFKRKLIGGRVSPATGDLLYNWPLKPQSSAKLLPEYIPDAIANDYEEACLIRDLSPKASATLSRRCLQGIIRDFWGISKDRLVDEIAAIKDKVDSNTWLAIDGIRKIGNIGAHMEKDIDLIVDVDPQEAGLLITLIEFLLKDWYIARYEKQQNINAIINAAKSKEAVKKTIP
jgi:hypothetical protein